jgi:two-component system sensor kinase FixL
METTVIETLAKDPQPAEAAFHESAWLRLPAKLPKRRVALLAGTAWAVALALMALSRDMLSAGGDFLLFIPAIIVASFFGGAVPGLIAVCVSILGRCVLHPEIDASIVLFSLIGVLMAFSGEQLLRGRQRGERAIQALVEREGHLRSIFDVAPDALIVIDQKGIIQAYSKAAQRMFGWAEFEVLGRNVSTLMPSPYREAHDRDIQRYVSTGQRRIIGIGRIVVGERKDGSTFPIELSVGEVRSRQGRFFMGFIRDLTERQQTEARLQELQAELVHMTRLSAMGEMASALAHELNQPLSAIANYLGGASRLMEQQAGGDRRVVEAVAKSSEQAIRAGDIIRRLRDFLARGEGERSIESLSKLVQEACTLALVGAKEYGVRVQYRLDPKVDKVIVDRVQIQQVVLNLVRNALDAMRDHDGRRELVVSTGPGEGEELALVSVADTGPGLEPSAGDRLFQPFVTTKSDGMGVGLSISRTIVEAHGGRIWTEPNPGGGAIFRFTVRLAREDAEARA